MVAIVVDSMVLKLVLTMAELMARQRVSTKGSQKVGNWVVMRVVWSVKKSEQMMVASTVESKAESKVYQKAEKMVHSKVVWSEKQ